MTAAPVHQRPAGALLCGYVDQNLRSVGSEQSTASVFMHPSQADPIHQESSLDARVIEVLELLHQAYGALVAALPGDISRPVDIEKGLKLPSKLAWQVFHTAYADPPLLSAASAPGQTAAGSVIKAAEKAGLDRSVLMSVKQATASFEEAVTDFADTRHSFELMVRSAVGEGLEANELTLKRNAYRVNRDLLGRSCAESISTMIVRPAETTGKVDLCVIRGHRHLALLRSDAVLELMKERFHGHIGSEADRVDWTSRGALELSDSQLVPGHTSDNLTPVIAEKRDDGFVRYYTKLNPIGLRNTASYFTWSVMTDVDYERGFDYVYEVSTPARLLIHDCLVEPSLIAGEPRLRLMQKRSDYPGFMHESEPPSTLPSKEHVEYRGRGKRGLKSPAAPRYTDLVETVCELSGFDIAPLDLYRTRIEYPILNSVVWLRYFQPDTF